jgi:hypothetical protein
MTASERSLPREVSKSQRIRLEQQRLEVPFWNAAIDTLNTRDTNILRNRVFAIAECAPHVSLPVVDEIVETIDEQYRDKDPRKFTDEQEINHAYQVAILTAHAIGWKYLSLGTFATALGHDYHENTPRHPSDIAPKSFSEVSDGIVALSHKDNGKKLYSDPKNKKPYFKKIIEVHKDIPDLEIATIKVVDQIAVANSPLTRDALTDPKFEHRWVVLSETKLGEMKLLLSLFEGDPKARMFNKEIRLLKEAIGFTSLRLEPYEDAKQALETVLFEREVRDAI